MRFCLSPKKFISNYGGDEMRERNIKKGKVGILKERRYNKGSGLIKTLPFFISMKKKAYASILFSILFFLVSVLFLPLSSTLAEDRYAKNLNFQTPCTEEDNINIPIYGHGISSYEIIATFPKYFPLEEGQEDLCRTDYTGCEDTWDYRPTSQIAYNDAASGELKFAWQSPGEWWYPIETPDPGTDASNGISLAYQPSHMYGVGNAAPPAIAYCDADGQLRYVIKNAWGEWGTPELLDVGNVCHSPCLRVERSVKLVDANDEVIEEAPPIHHLVYYDATHKELKYTYKPDPSVAYGWLDPPTVLDSSSYTGGDAFQYISLAIDPSGNLHVAYYDAENKDLKYLSKPKNGSWSSPVTLDSTGDVGRYASMTIYFETPPDKIGNAYQGIYPHIAYYDADNGNLKYIYKDKTGWSTPVVLDSTGDVGQYASLAFGPNGNLHLAYYDADNGNLKYIYKDKTGWSTPVVLDGDGIDGRSNDDVGQYASLMTNMGRKEYGASERFEINPRIAYYDATNHQLKHIYKSRRTDWEWKIEVVDSGNVGKYASLTTSGYICDVDQWGTELYNDGNMVVKGVDVPGWSLPHGMKINIVGEAPATEEYDYLRIHKRIADQDDFPEVFTLYGNGYARILPHPPVGRTTPVCYGASVIIGPAEEDELYPEVPIKSLTVDPLNSSVIIEYDEGSSARLDLKFERGKTTVRVSEITFDTFTHPFATLRSMWVADDNCDVCKIETSLGGPYTMDVTHSEWTTLPGDWWYFYRPVYSRHNTSAPDFMIKIIDEEVEPLRDWHDIWTSAVWWTSDGTEPFQYQLDRDNPQMNHTEKENEIQHSIKVIYNKADGDTQSEKEYGYFGAKIVPTDFSAYDYLSFWVYNDGSPLTFRIRLEDTSGNGWESNWAGFEPSMKTTDADWENLVVDLSRTFGASGIDMTSIDKIIFMVDPGNPSSSGTFWLDDVTLLKAPKEAPIEVFETDHYGWSTAATGAFTISLTNEEFHNEGESDSLGQQCLKISWTEKDLQWHNVVYDLLHDSTNAPLNRIGNYPDLTYDGNNTLSMWVKSNTDNDFGIMAKVYDVEPSEHPEEEGADLGTQIYTGAGSWQKLYWYYGDKTEAQDAKVIYFFPFPLKGNPNPGSIYIDDISLEVQPGPPTWYPDFYRWLDDVIRQIDEPIEQIGYLIKTAIAADIGYEIIHYLRKYKKGLEKMKGEVVTWKDCFTDWAQKRPGLTYWGSIYGFAAATSGIFWSALESYSEWGFAMKLGWTAAFAIAMANVGKAVVPRILSSITTDYILPELDFSAGIPDEYRSVLIFPVISFEMKTVQTMLDSIEKTYLNNQDPNNNLLIGILTDTRNEELLQAEIDGIKALEAKYGQHFFLIHRVPRYLNEEKNRKEGWWKKPGAVYEFNAWLMNDWQELQVEHENKPGSADDGPRQIGPDKCFDIFIGLGNDIPQGSSGTVTALGNIWAVLTLDEGNWDPGSKNPQTGEEMGGMIRILAKLAHPSNYDSESGEYYHKMIQPMMIPDNPENLPTWWARTLAREQRRMLYTVVAYNNIMQAGTFYGKGGYILAPTYNALKGFLPDYILSHDIVEGEKLNCAFAIDIEMIDDTPTNAVAQMIRDTRWCTGDVLNLAYTGILNVNTFPMFTNKIPTETLGWVQNPFSISSRIKIFENVRARVGDTALLTFFMTGYLAKTTPGIIAVDNVLLTDALFWGSMISIIAVPKLVGVKNAKDIGYAALDTGVTTACLLPNVFQNTVNVATSLYRMMTGNVKNIPWPTAASAEGQLTLKDAIACYLRGMTVGTGLLVGSAYLGIPITPKEWVMLSSWSGGGALISWLTAGTSLKERIEALLIELGEYKNWIKQGFEKHILRYEPPEERDDPEIPTPITIEDMEEILRTSYMFEEGTFTFSYRVPATNEEVSLGEIKYRTSPGRLDLLIDELTIYEDVETLTDGLLKPVEIAKALLLHAYDVNRDSLQTIFARSNLMGTGKPLKDVIDSLVSENCLSYVGTAGDYETYTILEGLKSAKFTISEGGKPKKYDPRFYDGYFPPDEDYYCQYLIPRDSEGNPVRDPDNPSQDLKIIDNYEFQGDKIEYDPVDEAVEFTIKGMKFILPLANFADVLPPEASSAFKFKLKGGDGLITDLRFNSATNKFFVGGEAVTQSLELGFDEATFSAQRFYSGLPVPDMDWVWRRYIKPLPGKLTNILNKLDLSLPGNRISRATFRIEIPTNIQINQITMGGHTLDLTWNEVQTLTKHPGYQAVEQEIWIYSEGGEVVGKARLSATDPGLFELKGDLFTKGGKLKEPVYKWLRKPMFETAQSVDFDLFASEGRCYYWEKRALIRTGNRVWGDKIYIDCYSTGVIDGTGTAKSFSEEYGYISFGKKEIGIEPRGLKRIHNIFARFMDRPYGMPVFVGALEGTMILYNHYVADSYVCTTDLFGDIAGAVAVTGVWTTADILVKWGPRALGGTGGLWIFPAMVLGEMAREYTKCAYSKWQAHNIVDGAQEFNLETSTFDVLYLAWLEFLDEFHPYEDFFAWVFKTREEMLKAGRASFEEVFTEELYNNWLESEAPYPEGGANATEEECNEYKYDLANIAKEYGLIFEKEILNAIIDGIVWYTVPKNSLMPPWWDTYGWYIDDRWDEYYWINYPNGGGTAPVTVTTIKDKLAKNIYNCWKKWSKGIDCSRPISEYLGYDLDLDWLLSYTRENVDYIRGLCKKKLDGLIDNTLIEVKEMLLATSKTTIDCVTAKDTLATLDGLLKDLNFADYKLYDTLLPNVGFEALEGEYESVFKEETTETTTTLDQEVLTGIRYYWDVRAHNASGWGPFGYEYASGNPDYFRSFVPE